MAGASSFQQRVVAQGSRRHQELFVTGTAWVTSGPSDEAQMISLYQPRAQVAGSGTGAHARVQTLLKRMLSSRLSWGTNATQSSLLMLPTSMDVFMLIYKLESASLGN